MNNLKTMHEVNSKLFELMRRKPVRFFVVTGQEKYKVVDLANGSEAFTDDKLEAYRIAAVIRNVRQHNYRLEVRS